MRATGTQGQREANQVFSRQSSPTSGALVFRDWRLALAPIDRDCDPKLAMSRHRGLSTGMMKCQLLPLVGTIKIADQRERQPKRYGSHRVITPSQRSWPVRQD
jgi:hypothetical protein